MVRKLSDPIKRNPVLQNHKLADSNNMSRNLNSIKIQYTNVCPIRVIVLSHVRRIRLI